MKDKRFSLKEKDKRRSKHHQKVHICPNYTKRNITGKFATGHRYFVSFAETHYSIVSLPKHTALLKKESLTHFFQNRSSQTEVLNILFLALRCVLANVSQNCNGT
jgi:hypothetical protein